MLKSFIVATGLLLGSSAVAHADGGSTVTLGATTLSCSAFASLGCEGHSTTWTGINIGSLSYRLSPKYELAGMMAADAEVHEREQLTHSQVMLAGGVRQDRGLGYIQLGAGLGSTTESIKSMGMHDFLSDDPRPVLLAGIAEGWRLSDSGVLRIKLDVGTTIDETGVGRLWSAAGSVSLSEF